MQHLIGMFVYNGGTTYHLQIIMIPLCSVTKKATDFQWEQEKRKAFETT